MKIAYVLLLAIISFACEQPTDPDRIFAVHNSGHVAFTFDKAHAPAAVKTLTAILSQSGYTTLEKTINIITDTSASILFEQVAVGTWKVKVDAKDENGKVLYTGESAVIVLENSVSQINLVLTPVLSGVGSVQINVTWGSNITEWIDLESNPILSRPNNSALIYGIHSSKVLRDNEKYYMWYSMGTPQGGVGVATSSDGINWVHQTTQTIIPLGQPGEWDGNAIAVGPVIKENGVFKMYFYAIGTSQRYRIGYATSSDGIHWEKKTNWIFQGDEIWNYSTVSSAIIKKDSAYLLYYGGRSINSGLYSIGLAVSNDGVSFTPYTNSPILVATTSWEANSIYFPSVIKDDNRYVMAYMNYATPSLSAFGLATSSDGINWQKDGINPFFSWSQYHKPWSSSEIAYPCLFKNDTETRLYYSGYTSTVGKIGMAYKK
jgi:predicted GH43/DUF377 family glycosyl hydrolase